EYGRVKKRLAAEIGEEAALKAYAEMLRATFNNVSKLQCVDIYGFYEGEVIEKGGKGGFEKGGIFELLKKTPLHPQRGNDLGKRMYNAIKWLSQKGYKKVALIGSDSPDLPSSFIKDAFERLESHELVIGPAEDGGYYLIGMKKPMDILFKNMQWGSNNVLKDTITHAVNAGINYFLLPQWYDVDNLNSLNQWS
ncbi:MAG: glycosyltransferase, partial [Nitrospira sp.]|nr:glycosyltransferase [Nitrospira sp.]